MNLSRCENGHFYDKEKFSSCPHCAQGAQTDNDMTSVFTESMDDKAMDRTESINLSGGTPFPVTEAIPLDTMGRGALAQDLTATVDTGTDPGMIDQVIYDNTMARGSISPVSPFEDDDHTQAFYEDIFLPQSGGPQMTSRIERPRVTTPCTGWLVAVNGSHVGQDFRLKAGKNFIGRDLSMDIALDGDRSVSRNKHAILVYEPKQHLYMIQPGESSELVYLNNEVVLNPTGIKAYDTITVGEINLLFIPLCGSKFNWNDVLKKK